MIKLPVLSISNHLLTLHKTCAREAVHKAVNFLTRCNSGNLKLKALELRIYLNNIMLEWHQVIILIKT